MIRRPSNKLKAVQILNEYLLEIDTINTEISYEPWKAKLLETLIKYIGTTSKLYILAEEFSPFTAEYRKVPKKNRYDEYENKLVGHRFDKVKMDNVKSIVKSIIDYISDNGTVIDETQNNSRSDNDKSHQPFIDSSQAITILENQYKKLNNGRYGIDVDNEIIIETGKYLKMFIGASQQEQFLMIRSRLYGGIHSEWDVIENKKQDMLAFILGSLQIITENGIAHKEFGLSELHSTVQEVAEKLFADGHYKEAILYTYIELVNSVKKKSGLLELDNTPLMQRAFSRENALIRVSKNGDEQMGFMWLFSGAVMGIRNPHVHIPTEQVERQKALEWLSFASALFRILDDSEVKG